MEMKMYLIKMMDNNTINTIITQTVSIIYLVLLKHSILI